MLQGLGAPACARLLTSWYPDKLRGTFWGIWTASNNVGGFAAPIIAGTAARAYGWRYALPAVVCRAWARLPFLRVGSALLHQVVLAGTPACVCAWVCVLQRGHRCLEVLKPLCGQVRHVRPQRDRRRRGRHRAALPEGLARVPGLCLGQRAQAELGWADPSKVSGCRKPGIGLCLS